VEKIGAKLALDAAAYVTGKEFQGFNDGGEVRRARLYAQGDCLLLLPVSYQLEIGYIPDEFYIEESYLKFKPIPYIGELKIGQYQAPMSLDMITSSRTSPSWNLRRPCRRSPRASMAACKWGIRSSTTAPPGLWGSSRTASQGLR